MHKIAEFNITGMNRDLAVSKFQPDSAFENLNMRIMSIDENSMLSLVNEKGNKLETSIKGIPIGQAVINDKAVIFTTGIGNNVDINPVEEVIDDILSEDENDVNIDTDFDDRIYKVWYDKDALKKDLLYQGNLNFDYKYPIETIPYYENDNIQKVYWVDGKNQPRVINISNPNLTSELDFVTKLNLQEKFFVRKRYETGVFPAGTIQYSFTYYNTNLQETNVVYTTPLYYISKVDKGGSPEDKLTDVFYIYTSIKQKDGTLINLLDSKYEYIRVYSILRTSINATPQVKRLRDIKISDLKFEDNSNQGDRAYNALMLIDDGTIGSIVDPTELLYTGGEQIVVSTFAQKNNTLFLGDIHLKRDIIPDDIKSFFQNNADKLSFRNRSYFDRLVVDPTVNQLDEKSSDIKSFKYLEWYRFGVQFQHISGRWSEPIWLKDLYNNVKIDGKFYDKSVRLVEAYFNIEGSDVKDVNNLLIGLGYIKARPVVVYPTIADREVLCQGVLCPTVYNVHDRDNNAPFVQSSWFTRINAPFDVDTDDTKVFGNNPIFSRRNIMANDDSDYDEFNNGLDLVKYGAWTEFRHNHPVPDSSKRNAEIQSIYQGASIPEIEYTDGKYNSEEHTKWIKDYGSNFFIDQSILTLHSPDIEFDTDVINSDTSNMKLRIVGMVPITATKSGIDIQTSTPAALFEKSTRRAPGFYKETVGTYDIITQLVFNGSVSEAIYGWRGLVSGIFWLDVVAGLSYNNTTSYDSWSKYLGFAVYPWHRTGSLSNDCRDYNNKEQTEITALLSHKTLANYRFSCNSQFMDIDNLWFAENESDTNNGISDAKFFTSSEVVPIAIKEPKNSNLGTIYYYGNVDKIINGKDTYNLNYTLPSQGRWTLTETLGYPIMCTHNYSGRSNHHNSSIYVPDYRKGKSLFTRTFMPLGEFSTLRGGSGDVEEYYVSTKYYYGTEPISMKYKSTPHAVVALNYTDNGRQLVLPTIYDKDSRGSTLPINNVNSGTGSNYRFFWQNRKTLNYNSGVFQEFIDPGIIGNYNGANNIGYGFLWLAELYRDNVSNRFGGTSEEAIKNNLWLPCGEAVNLIDINNKEASSSIVLEFTEGDTYYQRYDHLKTQPFTNEDTNSIVDIISFMCETRVNIAGRYDNLQKDFDFSKLTAETAVKFNQVNHAYSQENNYYSYRVLDENQNKLDDFRNTITWTKTKIAGETTDTWTNVTLASTLDLDGNKGYIRALRRVNDNLISFQDKAVSQILYNEQTQISTTSGVPIEIANSNKVQGYRTILDNIGCINKWSICQIPSALVFVDDLNKDIWMYGDKPINLSDTNGFHAWMGENATTEIWNPVDFGNIVTYYDTITDDVYFINKNVALAYNTPMAKFTSFYSYGKTPYMINLPHKTISLYGDGENYNIWLQNAGRYNEYFGSFKPFYTTVVVNPDGSADKIFDNTFFTADSWDENGGLLNTIFDTLTTWNEYQIGESKLRDIKDRPANLKKKFRMWRANIPRDSVNKRDRMRNPWLYLRLAMNDENYNKTALNTLSVQYFV